MPHDGSIQSQSNRERQTKSPSASLHALPIRLRACKLDMNVNGYLILHAIARVTLSTNLLNVSERHFRSVARKNSIISRPISTEYAILGAGLGVVTILKTALIRSVAAMGANPCSSSIRQRVRRSK